MRFRISGVNGSTFGGFGGGTGLGTSRITSRTTGSGVLHHKKGKTARTRTIIAAIEKIRLLFTVLIDNCLSFFNEDFKVRYGIFSKKKFTHANLISDIGGLEITK